MRRSLKKTLMERDGLSSKEADKWIEEISDVVYQYILEGNFIAAEEYFCGETGLEPDYLEDILF